jgi:glycerophosphoryl diester phosphodiesterase
MSAGLALRAGERSVRLKWHKLRRAAADPAHDRENLRQGIALGASLEVDLRATRDGHFVCLHDEEIAAETTGEGLVQDHDRAALERLRQRGNDGRPLATAPLFLDEVTDTLTRAPAGWPGRLQLDLQPPPAPFDAATVERFAALTAPVAPYLMLGGARWPAVLRLGRAVPGLRLGFDPCDIHEVAPPASAAEFEALGAYALAHAREAAIFYFHIPMLLRGLELGVDLIAMAKARGAEVDAWRLEPEDDPAAATLARLVEAGVDQITTDSPEALEQLWQTRKA